MNDNKRLSDILMNSERDQLEQAWSTTKAADDLKPLPAGEYRCRVAGGELFNSRSGTPGYKLTMEVIEGDHTGRRIWHDIWLSKPAMPMAKRDLAKLGVQSLSQLESPLPRGIVVAAKVALRNGDDGSEFNRIIRFEVVEIMQPPPDPFAPKDDNATDGDGFDWSTGTQQNGVPAP
jgi:hypothetical protein